MILILVLLWISKAMDNKKIKTFKTGSCMNSIGFSYSKAPYWRVVSGDKRPMLKIDAFKVTLWIMLPWSHAMKKGFGSFASSWGFYFRPFSGYLCLSFGDRSKTYSNRLKKIRRASHGMD